MGQKRTGTRNGEAQPFAIINNGRAAWRHEINLGTNSEGKRVVASGTGRTPQEAMKRAALNAEKKRLMGLNSTSRRRARRGKNFFEMTVREYGYYWHERLNPERHAVQVRRNYIRSLELHVFPHIGDLLVHEVMKQDIEDLFRLTLPAKKKKNGDELLGKSAMKNVFTPLSLMFKRAEEEDDIISRSPVLSKYGVSKSEIEEPEDVSTVPQKKHVALWMMEKARGQREQDPFTYLWLRMNFFGMRQGERNGLMWSDIQNLNKPHAATISITKQLVSEHGLSTYIKHKLKTKDSKRTFPIDEDLRTALLDWKKVQDRLREQPTWKAWKGEEFQNLVLTRTNGEPMTQKTDTNLWHSHRQTVLSANDPNRNDWRQHLNRHITASLFHMWGLSIEEAKRILGHSDTEMTRYYTAMSHSTLRKPVADFGHMITLTAKERRELERRQQSEIEKSIRVP